MQRDKFAKISAVVILVVVALIMGVSTQTNANSVNYTCTTVTNTSSEVPTAYCLAVIRITKTTTTTQTVTQIVTQHVSQSPQSLLTIALNDTTPIGQLSIVFPVQIVGSSFAQTSYAVANPQYNYSSPQRGYLGYYSSASTIDVTGCQVGGLLNITATIGSSTFSGHAICPQLSFSPTTVVLN